MKLDPTELALSRQARTQYRIDQYKQSSIYYWVRWLEHASFGESEIHFPNWYTGSGPRGRYRVAAIMGENVNDVMEFIRQSYDTPPEEIFFTFVEMRERKTSNWSDRFELADWMMWPAPKKVSPPSPQISIVDPGRCRNHLYNEGKPAPKTCEVCGLGPCQFGITLAD